MSFAAAKKKYLTNQLEAYRKTSLDLSAFLGVNFSISEFSNRTLIAVEEQWGESQFDWPKINKLYRAPDCAKFGIWVGDRLAGVCLIMTHDQSVKVCYLEGDSRSDCTLKGKRILIALDVAANYAQIRGKVFLDLEPINEKLIDLYQDTYGFEVVMPRKGPTFCRKRI